MTAAPSARSRAATSARRRAGPRRGSPGSAPAARPRRRPERRGPRIARIGAGEVEVADLGKRSAGISASRRARLRRLVARSVRSTQGLKATTAAGAAALGEQPVQQRERQPAAGAVAAERRSGRAASPRRAARPTRRGRPRPRPGNAMLRRQPVVGQHRAAPAARASAATIGGMGARRADAVGAAVQPEHQPAPRRRPRSAAPAPAAERRRARPRARAAAATAGLTRSIRAAAADEVRLAREAAASRAGAAEVERDEPPGSAGPRRPLDRLPDRRGDVDPVEALQLLQRRSAR